MEEDTKISEGIEEDRLQEVQEGVDLLVIEAEEGGSFKKVRYWPPLFFFLVQYTLYKNTPGSEIYV